MSIETIGLRAVITSNPRPRDYVNKKPLGKALEEVEKGLIQIQVGKE